MAEEQFACPQFACQNSSLPFLLPTIKKNVTTKARRHKDHCVRHLFFFVSLCLCGRHLQTNCNGGEPEKHGIVLTHRQTRRPLRSVLHFGHGRKWHEIGQPNDGQANEPQEDRWLKNHRHPIDYRSLSRLDVWYDEPGAGEKGRGG